MHTVSGINRERHQPVFEDDESDWSIASVSHMLIDAAAHVSGARERDIRWTEKERERKKE